MTAPSVEMWVAFKVQALRDHHPDWPLAGVRYVAERLYWKTYGQTGDEQQWFDEESAEQEGEVIYAEWCRR